MKPLIVIVGETASGKSSMGMKIAKHFNGEIVAADSWTVRQEVNIGTSKPTKTDQTEVVHHMIDVVAPCDDFSAALFKSQALNAIEDISNRGRLPIMVGGTGLYVDSVIFDYSFLDDSNNHYNRNELNRMSLEELIMLAKGKKLPLEKIDTRNKRRVIRLIETDGDEPSKQSLRDNTLIIGIAINRDSLKQNVQRRVDSMVAEGLEHEVLRLKNNYSWDCEALKGIGYIEWKSFFEGKQTLDETKQQIVSNTMKLAKRQRTWFKRNKSIHWTSKQSEAVDLVTTFLSKQ